MLTRRALLAAPALLLGAAAPPTRLAIITTLSGPAADGGGPGSVLAAQLAMADVPEAPATLLVADIGERPDTGAAIVREWLDRDGVQVVLDVPNSATALAVAGLVRERDRAVLFSGAGSSAITQGCNPNLLQWTYDTAALAAASGRAILADGGRSWFFITADYAFGHSLQADVTAVVVKGGGQVLGAVAFPGDMTDFSALLLQAKASGAEIVCLAAAGGPFQTLVKQAAEFGLAAGGQRLACPLCLITNVDAIGADAAGLLVTAPFYWDLTPETRAFAARMMEGNRGIAPTMVHAGVYAATVHALQTIAAGASPASGGALIAAMKQAPVRTSLFQGSTIRPDGRVAHPMHLFQVRIPSPGQSRWAYYERRATVAEPDAYTTGRAC